MEQKKRKLLYDIILAIIGAGLGMSIWAAAYGHLWLQEFQGPASDLALLLSEDIASEKSKMETIRLFGAIGAVVTTSLIVAMSPAYNSLLQDPRWEYKKSLASGLFILILSSVLYLFSTGLSTEAMAWTGIAIGVTTIVTSSAYLAMESN